MEQENVFENKSICCTKIPELFFIDKQGAKKYFSQFGSIRRFILYPSKCECVVEYETMEGAQRALNAKVDFQITPARQSPKSEYFIDPDVQSELESMQPVGSKQQMKIQQIPAMESYIKNPPQSFFKPSKQFTSVKAKTEQLTVQTPQADPRQIQIARNELEALCKKPARTAEEKFAILDARDKLYRVINARPADIKKAESTKGTCMDMCPEKERLMRVARLQVSSFEQDDEGSTMDPTRAIKQYSRSSADQEIPLPHELRSDSVLKATMTYLLYNIMNLCDDEHTPIGDWFHFIWDRTRGIRKDITQQELCTPNSVELLEQCVRFHIHCSARLIAEDPSVFDSKINDENLTKSLQTLKYMYDDLKVRNIKCPNEAEFRAYVVLLNLNDSGNFLWEIKRLEKDILDSSEIRFALEVYFAVSLNNYVKFFNLVRNATYMNACLMLRYFTQIRKNALYTIIRSYISRRGQGLNFSISYLTEILAFEDDDAAINFLTHHCALCDKDADTVNLDSRTFDSADMPFQMERALEIVESKMEGSVAEAICGSPLPDPEIFLKIMPHSSFDDRGFFKKEAFYAEDQNGPLKDKDGVFKIPMESPPMSPVRNMLQTKQKIDQPDSGNIFSKSNVFTNTFAQSKQSSTETSNIFGKSVFDTKQVEVTSPSNPFFMSKPISSPITISSPSSTTSSQSSIFGNSQFSSSPSSFKSGFSISKIIPNVSVNKEEEIRKRLEEEQRKRKEEEEMRRNAEAEKLRKHNEELLRLKMEEKRLREEAERLRIEQEEKRRQEVEKMRIKKLESDSQNILDSLIDEIVEKEVTIEAKVAVKLFCEIPTDFYEALEYDTVVEELFKIYNLEMTCYINSIRDKYRMLSTFFKAWHLTTKQQIEKRKKLSNIGCTVLNQSLDEIANELHHPQQEATLSNMKVYLSGKPQQIKLPDLDNYRKIELFKELKISTLTPLRKFYWKILISVPFQSQEKCTGFSSFIKTWLAKTFDVKENEEIFYLQSHLLQNTTTMASLCMRKLQGIDAADEKNKRNNLDAIQNANSMLFFCTTSNLEISRKRLGNILKNLTHPIAVSIIIYKNLIESTDEQLIANHMNLTGELNVVDFEINIFYECHEKMKDLTEVVMESCQFLCDSHLNQLQRKDAKIFDLEMQHIHDFLQFCVGDEMWQRIEISCRDSKDFNIRMKSFNNIVQVYNSCLDKLVEIMRKDFSPLPSFPIEFSSKLAPFEVRIPNSYEYFPKDWKSDENQKKIVAFLNDMRMTKMINDEFRHFDDFKEKLSMFLLSNVSTKYELTFNAVLEKVVNGFYRLQLQRREFSDDFVSQSLDKLSWLEIFGVIVVGRFNEIQKNHQNLPSFVIYDKSDLRKYLVPWWYKTKFSNPADEDFGPRKKKARTVEQFDMDDLQAILKKGAECSKKIDIILQKSKKNLAKPPFTPKSFDQYLYKCEEQFKFMKESLDSILMNEKSLNSLK